MTLRDPALLGRARLLAVCLALCAAHGRAPGSADDVEISQLGLERWSHEHGLAGGWVTDIVEDRAGFLWVATSGGLSRFDGRTFRNYTAANEPELPNSAIRGLALDRDGSLWVGLLHGGVRVVVNGALRRSPWVEGLPQVPVRSLVADRAGTLWIGTEKGLWKAGPGGPSLFVLSEAARTANVWQLVAAPDGAIWARTRDHGLWRIEKGTPAAVPDVPGCLGLGLTFAPDGHPVTACGDGVWERQAPGEEWTLVAAVDNAQRLLFDRHGALWFGDRNGLFRHLPSGGTELLPVEEGLGDYRIRAFLEDSRGELWVGTYAAGLARLRRGAAVPVGRAEGLPALGTTAVAADPDGDLWIGTADHGLFRWRRGAGLVGRWTVADGLPCDRVWAIALDARQRGRLWLGTRCGLVSLENGLPRRVERPGGRSEAEVMIVYSDPAVPGTVWAGGRDGSVDEVRGDVVTRHGEEQGLRIGRVFVFHRERSGGLLAAGERGVFRYDGSRWHELSFAGEDVGPVHALLEEADGTLWLASTARGLERWSHGKLVRLSETAGLPGGGVFSLELDGLGGLWLSNDHGLMRLRLDDFDRWARGELGVVPVTSLTARDGLRDHECNGWGRPASGSLPDGTLVFPTMRGIALASPSRLPRAELAPARVFVDRLVTGTRMLATAGVVRLEPDERDLQVRFGAVEFTHPEAVTFRYRLEGLDDRWVPAGRQAEAAYSHLLPGRYRLRLQARLPGQEWVEASLEPTVEVVPRLVEATWFRLLAGALVLFVAGALVRWRVGLGRAHARELSRERAFLRAVIDTSPNPIFARRTDLAYTLANRAAAAVYGLAPDQLEGRTAAEAAPGVGGIEVLDSLERTVIATGAEGVVSEARGRDAAGAERWYRVVDRPLVGPAGAVEQVVGTAVDITDYKLAEEQLRRSETELAAGRQELQRLASALLKAQEEERARLAREIHDDFTQRLAGLAMLTGSCAQTLRRRDDRTLAGSLEEVGRELERLASEAQAISRELHPSLLTSLGLEAALRAECATFAARTGLGIDYRSERVPEGLPPQVGIVLYRIAQEALRNVLAHSGSKDARVTLEGDEAALTLSVSDSGAGFDPVRRSGRAGLGLTSMTERASLVGAALAIESSEGSGTCIRVRVPAAAWRLDETAAIAPGSERVAG